MKKCSFIVFFKKRKLETNLKRFQAKLSSSKFIRLEIFTEGSRYSSLNRSLNLNYELIKITKESSLTYQAEVSELLQKLIEYKQAALW